MDRDLLAPAFIVALFALLALGIPIGVVILVLAGAGILLATNIDVTQALATAYYSLSTQWGLTALPLFVLMGELLGRSGVSIRLYDACSVLLGRVPGGLLQVNILSSTLFAALSGSSTATVATMGKLSLPRLREHGYSDFLSLGSLAGAGTLGILIPPSVALILYGFSFDVPISELFLAGVFPGLMLAMFFSVYVGIFGGRLSERQSYSRKERVGAILSLLPLIVLVLVVFGSIYGGFATPTEAAVIGVVGALVLSAFENRRLFDVAIVRDSLRATMLFSAAIGFVLAASAGLQVAMAYTGIPRTIVSWLEGGDWSQAQLLLLIGLILLVLGCFIDGLSMIVLTSAVLQPAIASAGIDPLWFGVFMVILVEVGLITPPIGFNLFVLQKAGGVEIPKVALAALPFLLILLSSLFVIWALPQIVTFLPSVW